jgi:acyl dehydratase
MITYLKAALPMVPGASKLPFVAGGGGGMPGGDRTASVTIDAAHLADYAKVCGFRLRDEVPATYPHVLAFGLHMDLMTAGDFPFPAIGLVHIENAITQHRAIRIGEELALRVTPTAPEPHAKGTKFSIETEATVGGEVVWSESSTMLRRGKGDGEEKGDRSEFEPPAARAEWRLPGDLGRRYGGVSGDRNPIHIHPITARAFGFPKPIAHGMWTTARSLAAMEARLPDAFSLEVAFKKPIFLPGKVSFGSDGQRFAVWSKGPHLEGTVTPA